MPVVNMRCKEHFSSIQGEGVHQGRKCTFVRFAGCNLSCAFCDTKEHDTPPYTEVTPLYLSRLASRFRDEYIVLTGGEPLYQPRHLFIEFVELLLANGSSVGIETNGSVAFDRYSELSEPMHRGGKLWITVSPKPPLYAIAVIEPDEIKLVEDESVTDDLLEKLEFRFPGTPLIIQPQSCSLESFARCRELQDRHPRWLIKLQMHRMMEIR